MNTINPKQLLAGNNSNLVREAILSLTNPHKASQAIRRVLAQRSGGGSVILGGAYTGNQDTQIEVEIVDQTIDGDPLISAPEFRGIGNGDISGISATSGTPAQTITITLEDLGTRTLSAYTDLGGVRLEAVDPPGNDIRITIDRSALATASTEFALVDEIRAGTNEYRGDQWNFGAVTLAPDGTIPADAPRLIFGDKDALIYRQYREFRDGEYVYRFSPEPANDIPAGTQVLSVSGTYTVTVSNGATTDPVYSNITTLFDLLRQIQSNTAGLIRVAEGVVSADATPGGMHARDLNLFTHPYIRRLNVTPQSEFLTNLDNLSVRASASATEIVSIRCAEASAVGQEQWEVRGPVSGLQQLRAVTGTPYNTGPLAFTVPLREVPPITGSQGRLQIGIEQVARGEGESEIQLCEDKTSSLLGPSATNGTYTFTYRTRPEPADCDAVEISGRLDPSCIGLENIAMSDLDPRIRQRVERVYRDFAVLERSNAGLSGDEFGNRLLQAVNPDFDVIREVKGAALSFLNDMQSGGTLSLPAWTADTDYSVDQVIEPTAANGFRYRTQTSGQSAADEPDFGTALALNSTVADGGVTWENIGKTPLGMFDDLMDVVLGEVQVLADRIAGKGLHFATWQGSTAATVLRPVLAAWRLVPTVRNGHSYILVSDNVETGITGASEPTWPTDGTTVDDNGLVWRDAGAYWEATTPYVLDQIIDPHTTSRTQYRVTQAGNSGASEPDWNSEAPTLTDGTVVWTRVDHASDIASVDGEDLADFAESLATRFNEVRAAGGLANFDSAGSEGNRCWQDLETDWWESSEGLQPLFHNNPYHSSREVIGPNGRPIIQQTNEFGVLVAIAGTPKDGDRITIRIDGVAGRRSTYNVGDTFLVDVVASRPIEFGGGQIGNDEETWTVSASESGVLSNYVRNVIAPAAYNDGGIQFLIETGGIKFGLGAQFEFSLEGGHFRWREVGGVFSADLAIDDLPVPIGGDGLEVSFDRGRAPSFESGDRYVFDVLAINGPDQIRQPLDQYLIWESAGNTIGITPASAGPVDAVLIALHAIDSGASITLQASDDAGFSTLTVDQALSWRKGVICHVFDQPVTANHWRIVISSGTGRIGWVYLGTPFRSEFDPGTFRPEVRLAYQEGSTLDGKGRFLGTALGGEIDYQGLPGSEFDALIDLMVDALQNNQRRIGLVPHAKHADEATMVFIDVDQNQSAAEFSNYHPSDKDDRHFSLSLPLSGLID